MSRSLSRRATPAYGAFLLHRLSGLALALFLPAHFYVLALALEGEAALDGFLRWTESPLLKLSEFVLVGLLAVHLTGGLRLLALEFLPWSERQNQRIAIASGLALAAALMFLMEAF